MKTSAIVVSRNDNPNNFHRIFLALNTMLERYDEVILVDYGSENKTLLESIEGIQETGRLREIVVTAEEVASISPSKDTRFIEVFARNIGIRRATGDFIVSTNQDIMPECPIGLDMDTLYTVARRNVPEPIFENTKNYVSLFAHLKQHKYNFQQQPDMVDKHGNATWDPGDIWSLVVCCGDYQIAHRQLWEKIRGFEESMIYRNYADSNLMKKGYLYGKIKKLLLDIFHLNHPANVSTKLNLSNDRMMYVNNFTGTRNPDTWGFSELNFKERIV